MCIGEAAIRWEASQASGLKMDLEAQLEDAGLPKIAIEVRRSAVQGFAGRHVLAVGPAQQQLLMVVCRCLWHALTVSHSQTVWHSVAMVDGGLCSVPRRWTGRTTLPATLAPRWARRWCGTACSAPAAGW